MTVAQKLLLLTGRDQFTAASVRLSSSGGIDSGENNVAIWSSWTFCLAFEGRGDFLKNCFLDVVPDTEP